MAALRAAEEHEAVTPVPWSRLRPAFLARWEPGEHLAIVGPTGSGKSHVAVDLLEGRAERRGAHVIALATKRRDRTMTELGWPIIREWPPDWDQRQSRRIILWPPYGKASTARNNKKVFTEALDEILEEGGWTVYLDEAVYFTETLGMRGILDEYWNTARSSGITVVSSSQGTTWVPKASLTQQQWLIVFRVPDEDTRDGAARIAGDRRRFEPIIAQLGEFEFLLVRTRTGEAYVSKVGT